PITGRGRGFGAFRMTVLLVGVMINPLGERSSIDLPEHGHQSARLSFSEDLHRRVTVREHAADIPFPRDPFYLFACYPPELPVPLLCEIPSSVSHELFDEPGYGPPIWEVDDSCFC